MKRLVLFLVVTMCLTGLVGCGGNISLKLDENGSPEVTWKPSKGDGTFTPIGDVFQQPVVEGAELMCLADSQAEAEDIAELYDITLVEFANGVATFTTDKDLQEVIQIGKDNGWTELSINHIIELDDPVAKPIDGFEVKMIDGTDEELLEDMGDVNEELQEVSDSEKFQKADDKTRYALLTAKLTELELQKRITNVRYNSEDKCFYFVYAYGSEGAWSLHPNEWDPEMN